jgi:uncharacterized protein (DUF2147 family)
MANVAQALVVAAAAGLALAAGAIDAQAGGSLDGLWMDSDGEVILEVTPCGDARCGRVVWLKQPLGPDGLPLTDYRNSDPQLRSRPVCGLEVVSGFKKQSDGSWGGGSVYVSDQGTSYSGVATVLSPTQVEVTGYIGLPIFGASEVWTKVSTPVERCSNGAREPAYPQWTTKIVAPSRESKKKK